MSREKLLRKWGGLDKWKANYGDGMESRGADGVSWYDLSYNVNTIPCDTDTAIIVTAWFGQLKWLKSALESYRKSGAFVILAYDNPFYPWIPPTPHDIIRCMPNMNHYVLANSFVLKHLTADSNKRNGWFWNIRYAQGVIKSFPNIKYVYHTNGDCVWDKPEGLKDLKAFLGDNDIMAGQTSGDVLHTADVIYKKEAFDKVVDYMYDIMRIPILGSHSPEVMLRNAVVDLKLKVLTAPKQPLDPKDGSVDMYARYGQDSTLKDLVGFRNVFAEYETMGNEGKEMMFLKPYFDDYENCIYWGGEEKETICQYWKTGDRRYLYKFWDQWEDSDYNRLYYPLEAYGKEPILE